MREDGFLTRLDLAFSRDQRQKIYVQDRMVEHGARAVALAARTARTSTCAATRRRMAKDVDDDPRRHRAAARQALGGGRDGVHARPRRRGALRPRRVLTPARRDCPACPAIARACPDSVDIGCSLRRSGTRARRESAGRIRGRTHGRSGMPRVEASALCQDVRSDALPGQRRTRDDVDEDASGACSADVGADEAVERRRVAAGRQLRGVQHLRDEEAAVRADRRDEAERRGRLALHLDARRACRAARPVAMPRAAKMLGIMR